MGISAELLIVCSTLNGTVSMTTIPSDSHMTITSSDTFPLTSNISTDSYNRKVMSKMMRNFWLILTKKILKRPNQELWTIYQFTYPAIYLVLYISPSTFTQNYKISPWDQLIEQTLFTIQGRGASKCNSKGKVNKT